MFSRHDICDADWNRIGGRLPGRPDGVGTDNRLFVDAIRYLAETGIAWADLPTCYGKSNGPWRRYNRWCRAGVWQRDDDTG